jgi:hypothetical protein
MKTEHRGSLENINVTAEKKEPSRILLARRPGRSLDRQRLSLAIDLYRQKFLLLSPALPAQAKFR